MTIGVYVAGDDEALVDAVASAVDRDERVWLASSPREARVVLAEPAALSRMREQVPDAAALVVLASVDAIGAARAALRAGADGIVSWPQDAPTLGARLGEAAARKVVGHAEGQVVAVVGARGGAGATTIAAHLAAALGPDALLLDVAGGAAGQALYAAEPATATLATVGGPDVTLDALRRAAVQHPSAVLCVFGADAQIVATEALVECALMIAPLVIVDGPAPRAHATVVVLAPDVGSVRSAAAMLPNMPGRAEVVLNRAGAGRIRPRDVRRALGIEHVREIPMDRRLARAADYGRPATRGPGRRAIGRLAAALRT